MPAEWADVSAAGPWLESPLCGKRRSISRPVQQGWGRSGNYGRQAGRPEGKTSGFWGEGEEGESEEGQKGRAQ